MPLPKELLAVTQRYAQHDYSVPLNPAQYADTEYATLAQAIEALAQQAKQAEDTQRVFVSNVAHELRTPIAIISGYVDGILDGAVPKNEQTQTLSTISQETRRLNAMITSMLHLSRMESGTLQPNYQWFLVNDVAFHTMLMFQSRLEKRGISVVGLDSAPLRIYADSELIGQAIFNIVENAVKFTNENGTITFSFVQTPQDWRIAIRNTGTGLSPEEIPKLTTRGYQANSSQNSDKTGLGIGLDITYRILQLHHAQLLIHSELHAYTEFEMRLPQNFAPAEHTN